MRARIFKYLKEDIMTYYNQKALDLHQKLQGKIEIKNKLSPQSLDDLSLLYSPGVASPCLEIEKETAKVYDYTWKGNTIAVISNGSAVLGLGDIGAEAGLPVMEGKSLLFKAFADVNAVPIMLDSTDPEEIIRTIEILAPTFGGINLEDIQAPDCVYIEEELKKRLNIPVFHDDQHGTAIVVLAGLMNAFKYLNKDLRKAKVVVSGTGAAGTAIIRILNQYGVKNIYASNSQGLVDPKEKDAYNPVVQSIIKYLTELNGEKSLSDALDNADVFIGVSVSDIINEKDVERMAQDPVIFALANPNPEIAYDKAKRAGASIVGTGRSDYPNQINNVLAFPGIFKGALSVRASEINDAMKLAAAEAIASVIEDKDLHEENIIPKALDERVVEVVSKAVADKAIEMGVGEGRE